MTKVVLHGELGKVVGRKVWMLSVKGVAEALRAIETNTGKLFHYLRMHNDGQALYSVLLNERSFGCIEELKAPIEHDRIDIVPVLSGAGSSDILLIIGIALVLVAATIVTLGAAGVAFGATAGVAGGVSFFGVGLTATAGWVAGISLSLGASMLLSGISSMLTPKPDEKGSKTTASYIFSGAVNTTEQGNCVPVGYGEMIVGAATISAGLSANAIPV